MVDLDDAGCLLLPFKLLGFLFFELFFEGLMVRLGRLILWPFGKRNAGEFTAGMVGCGVFIAACYGTIALL
jgi:hypothetical protein